VTYPLSRSLSLSLGCHKEGRERERREEREKRGGERDKGERRERERERMSGLIEGRFHGGLETEIAFKLRKNEAALLINVNL